MNIIKDVKVSTMLNCTSDKHRMIVDVSFERPVTSEYANLYIESIIHQLKTPESINWHDFDEITY